MSNPSEPTSLDEIEASRPTKMTDALVRLFAYAGCKPTSCHACQKKIKVGDTFRLIPHKRNDATVLIDEMVCDKHGEADLVLRDKREIRAEAAKMRLYSTSRRGGYQYMGGYSRPSKVGS